MSAALWLGIGAGVVGLVALGGGGGGGEVFGGGDLVAAPPPRGPDGCSLLYYPAAHHGGTRALSSIRLVVLHDTEGSSAASSAAWFQDDASGGSAHLVVGRDGECFRCLDDDVVPWGAVGGDANLKGLHLEFDGHVSFTRADWLRRGAELRAGADRVASWCRQYGIPARLVTGQALRDALSTGSGGVTTHEAITDAFHVTGNSAHRDPGPNFPLAEFMTDVQGRV